MSRFEGQVAFITGAARGQGRATSVRLASEGASIIGLDICGPVATSKIPPATPDDLAETARLVDSSDGRFIGVLADVRDYVAVATALDRGVALLGGRLDIVVANAGIVSAGRTWELAPEQWNTMIDVNLTGVWHTVRAAVPHMITAGNGGSIVLTSSIAGLRGVPYEAHYAAAKHGIVGLCRTLAIEVSEFGIRVNTIHPNGVDTMMMLEPDLIPVIRTDPKLAAVVATALSTGNQKAEDVAGAVAWLCSHEARFITGAQVPLSSGNQLM